MKSTGIVRNVDELGRIVIPKEIRTKQGIANGDPAEIFVDGDAIIIKKYNPSCHFCGSSAEIFDFKGKKICGDCLRELRAALV